MQQVLSEEWAVEQSRNTGRFLLKAYPLDNGKLAFRARSGFRGACCSLHVPAMPADRESTARCPANSSRRSLSAFTQIDGVSTRNLKDFVPQASFLKAIRQSRPANIAQRSMNRRDARPKVECRLKAIGPGSFMVTVISGCGVTLSGRACPLPKMPLSARLNRDTGRGGRLRLAGAHPSNPTC